MSIWNSDINLFLQRLANSVEQWRKRVDVLSKRIEEFEPKIRQNIMDFQKLVDSKDQACKYVSSHTENIYNLVLSSWQMKVSSVDVFVNSSWYAIFFFLDSLD